MTSRETYFNWKYIAARTILTGFRLVGLAPFSARTVTKRPHSSNFDTSQDFASIKFSLSHFGCAYNFCLSIIHCSVLCVGISSLNHIYYLNRSAVTETLDFVLTIFTNVTLFVIWLTFAFRQKTAVRLLNQLFNADSVTSSLKTDSSSCFIAIVCITNVAIWIGIITSSIIGYSYPLLTYLSYMVAFHVCCWFVLHYTFTIKLIENRFVALNRALLGQSNPLSAEIPHGLFPANKISHNISELEIATMRRTFTGLCETASEISDFYSTPILLTIASLSAMIVYNAYYVTVPFVRPLERPPPVLYLNEVLSLISESLPIVLLALGVGNIAGEIKQTTDIVRKLLIVSNNIPDHKVELKVFFLELLHRKVEFSACGLFSLDCTILLSIISMACTYLVILLQLQMG